MTSLLEMTYVDWTGAHSWVRKTLTIAMEGEQTNYIWGTIDIIPHKNFHGIQSKSVIHSENGSCMIIQKKTKSACTSSSARKIIFTTWLPDELTKVVLGLVKSLRWYPVPLAVTSGNHTISCQVAWKTLSPYIFEDPELFDWWNIYTSG